MLETQKKWYLPAMNTLGWHIGFWNLIGAIGFTLCGALGFGINAPGVEYASTLATFIGSWAFLVSSMAMPQFPFCLSTSIGLSRSDNKANSVGRLALPYSGMSR